MLLYCSIIHFKQLLLSVAQRILQPILYMWYNLFFCPEAHVWHVLQKFDGFNLLPWSRIKFNLFSSNYYKKLSI